MSDYDDRVSAYLDDELDPNERRLFEADLAASTQLQRELRQAGEVRAALRSLGPVAVPAPTRSRRRWPIVVAAAAAVLVLSLFTLPVWRGDDVAVALPDVAHLALQHRMSAESATADDFVALPIDAAKDMAPDMAPMNLVAAYVSDDVTHLLYQSDAPDGPLSVFVKPGRCDLGDLDPAGQRMVMNGASAWTHVVDAQKVVVVNGTLDQKKVVFTVIGAADRASEVQAAAEHLPI